MALPFLVSLVRKKTGDKKSTEEVFFKLLAITSLSGLWIFSGFAHDPLTITMALHTDKKKHYDHRQTCTTDKSDTLSEERLSQMQNRL